MKNANFVIIVIICSTMVLLRAIPELRFISPILALPLFLSNHSKSVFNSFVTSSLILIIGDFILNNFVIYNNSFTDLVYFPNYLIFTLFSFLLITLLYKIPLFSNVLMDTILRGFISCKIFYIVSNIGVWLSDGYYSTSILGMGESLVMGFPFFIKSLGSTLFYLLLMESCLIIVHAMRSKVGFRNVRQLFNHFILSNIFQK